MLSGLQCFSFFPKGFLLRQRSLERVYLAYHIFSCPGVDERRALQISSGRGSLYVGLPVMSLELAQERGVRRAGGEVEYLMRRERQIDGRQRLHKLDDCVPAQVFLYFFWISVEVRRPQHMVGQRQEHFSELIRALPAFDGLLVLVVQLILVYVVSHFFVPFFAVCVLLVTLQQVVSLHMLCAVSY